MLFNIGPMLITSVFVKLLVLVLISNLQISKIIFFHDEKYPSIELRHEQAHLVDLPQSIHIP